MSEAFCERDPIETQVLVHGAQISAGEGLMLTHADIHAHNTFQDREKQPSTCRRGLTDHV